MTRDDHDHVEGGRESQLHEERADVDDHAAAVPELLDPVAEPPRDLGVDDRLERRPPLGIGEDDRGEPYPVEVPIGPQDARTERVDDAIEPGRTSRHGLAREMVRIDRDGAARAGGPP